MRWSYFYLVTICIMFFNICRASVVESNPTKLTSTSINNTQPIRQFNFGMKKAVKYYYQEAAIRGDTTAQNNLGIMYKKGKNVEKDYAKAVKWFQKAADQGDMTGQYNLGIMYEEGKGVEKDYAKAVEWFQKAADQGDMTGQLCLAYMHEENKGVEKDYNKAIALYQKVTDNSKAYKIAQNNLGRLYWEGEGIEKDPIKAAQLFQKSVDQGYAVAQCNLGYMYFYGDGIEQNKSKGIELIQKAADQGYAIAQCKLGELYRYGYGVKKDIKKSFNWYSLAAQQDDLEAKQAMQKITWRAAKKGHPEAQYRIGKRYQNNQTYITLFDLFADNNIRTLEWFTRAHEQGHKEARRELGFIYAQGKGVTPSTEIALNYFKESLEKHDKEVFTFIENLANQGDNLAQYRLGEFYEFPAASYPKNYIQAFKYYILSANQNNPAALCKIGNFYAEGKGVEDSDENALEAYAQAAAQNYADAYTPLGNLYEAQLFKDNTQNDEKILFYTQAKKWYERAFKEGYLEVNKDLNRLEELKPALKIQDIPENRLFKEKLIPFLDHPLSDIFKNDFIRLTDKLSSFNEDVQGIGIHILQQLAKFSAQSKQVQVIIKRIDSILGNRKKINIDDLSKIREQIAATQEQHPLPHPMKIPVKIKINYAMIEDPRIDLFNNFFNKPKSYNVVLYKRAVKFILDLYQQNVDSGLINPNSEILYDQESEPLGTIESLKDLLTKHESPTNRLAHRVIENANILKTNNLDPQTQAYQLMSWAVAGLSCGNRCETEMDKFYILHITKNKFLEHDSSSLELRVALCLARLRENLLELQVPEIEEQRIHKINHLAMKSRQTLGLIGDIEEIHDPLVSSIGEKYINKSIDEIKQQFMLEYTADKIVEYIMDEINKKPGDTSIPYSKILVRVEDTCIQDENSSTPIIQDFYSDEDQAMITPQGVKSLLLGLNYLERDFD